MSDKPEIPNLKYAISNATCCGEGNHGEFQGMAKKNLLQIVYQQEELWGFAKADSAPPTHGLGHEVLVGAASIFPQTQEMQRIIDAPRYQGDMQYEFFVLGVQRAIENINRMAKFGRSEDHTKDDIMSLIEDRALTDYENLRNISRGTAGNKAAFYLGMTEDPSASVFDVRQSFGFQDVAIHEAAQERIKQRGEANPMAKIEDGDSYIDGSGQRQIYHKIQKPDFSDPTWSVLTERAATFIHLNQEEIKAYDKPGDFMKEITFGQLYTDLLESETASKVNRNEHFETVIGYESSEYELTGETPSAEKAQDLENV